jgi:hypothetical protein
MSVSNRQAKSGFDSDLTGSKVILGPTHSENNYMPVTTDQNLRYQQNLANRRLAILVLPFASWPKLTTYRRTQSPIKAQ